MLNHIFKPKFVAKAVALGLASCTAFTYAQEAQSPEKIESKSSELETIVITARKRIETIQETPLTLQAFSADQIEKRGVDDVAGLTDFTPGINFNGGTSRANGDFSVRGMTQVAATGDNRRDLVTVFIDGVPIIGSPAVIGAEDLARVEVIKGPQSALFGRATFGGAISMVTADPNDEFGGHIDLTAATYGDGKITMALEGPLVDDLITGRVMYEKRDFDGFYDNSLGGKLGGTDQRYASAALKITPTEDLSFKIRYSDRSDFDGEAATQLVARYDSHNCGPFVEPTRTSLLGLPSGMTIEQASMYYCGAISAPSGSFGINTSTPAAALLNLPVDKHGMSLDHSLLSLTADWEFAEGYSATLVLSDQDHRVESLFDFERTSTDTYQSYNLNKQSQQTFELRIQSFAQQGLTWMAGISRLDADYITAGSFIYGSIWGSLAGTLTSSLTTSTDNSKTDSIFGSIGYDVTDDINVSIEVRHQKDQISSGVGTPNVYIIETPSTLPRFLVRWDLDKENNIYFNYAKGNQPTQGYSTYFRLTEEQKVVASANGINASAPEAIIENYEMGLKHRSADGTWFLNSSIYYLEWTDRQAIRTIQVDLNGDGQITLSEAPDGEVFNTVPFGAGDSNTKGIELDGAYLLTDNITIGGSASYADTEITRSLNNSTLLTTLGLTDAKGKQFALVPKAGITAYFQYDEELSNGFEWYARLDSIYSSKRYTSITNLSWIPGHTKFNLRAGIGDGQWQVTGFINNLFDDDTVAWARTQGDSVTDPYFFSVSAVEIALPEKRQIGVTLQYHF